MKDYREMAEDVLRRRDAYVAERRKRMKKTVSMISCFCLVALLGAGAWYGSNGSGNSQADLDGGGMDGDPAGYSVNSSGTEKQTGVREFAEEESETDSSYDMDQGVQDECEVSQSCCEGDAPAQENLISDGNLKAYDKWWGGSYTDELGRTVILLTEDTPENRQTVFEMNPDLLESNTVFRRRTIPCCI